MIFSAIGLMCGLVLIMIGGKRDQAYGAFLVLLNTLVLVYFLTK